MPMPDTVPGGKQRLLQAAHGIFLRSSYHEASVSSILERAGVQPPTLYHHYGDKEGLYVAWAKNALADLRTALEPSMHRETSFEKLAAFGETLLHPQAPDLPQILKDAGKLVRASSGESVAQSYFECIVEPLCDIFVRGFEIGDVRPDNVSRLADTFLAGCYGLGPLFGRSVGSPSDSARWWAGRFATRSG